MSDTPLNYGLKPSREHLNWKVPYSVGQSIIAVDQAKFNLAWLVFPEIDNEGIAALPAEYVESMKFMDYNTRAALSELPLTFLAYWAKTDTGDLALTEAMPQTYRTTMAQRANEAQQRILGIVEEGNVVKVNFRKRA